jgi:hypothetical protein
MCGYLTSHIYIWMNKDAYGLAQAKGLTSLIYYEPAIEVRFMRGAAGTTSFSPYGKVYRRTTLRTRCAGCWLDHASAERFHREAKLLASVRIATIHGSKKSENIGAGFRRKVFSSGGVF